MTDLVNRPVTTTPTLTALPTQARRTAVEPDPAAAVAALKTLLPGQVVGPDDEAWEAARLGWVVNVDQRPAAVVTVREVEDVVAAVTCAARHGLTVSVQPVGHGATEALTGAVLLRTGALQGVEIDTERRVARVEAGVKWGTFLAALEPTGLIAPAGSSPDVSVVGYTLGGGMSWFSRAVGTASQHVEVFEIVDAYGVPARVTADSHPDLFWAMRGGGGDFGVVTAIEMRLVDAGPVLGGRMMWPIEMAYPVLHAYRTATQQAPEELSLWAHLFRFPPMPELPEEIRGRSFVSVDLTYLGGAGELDELLAPFRELPAMVRDSVGQVPLGRLGDIAAEPVDPMPTMETAGLLADLDEATVDRLLEVAGASAEIPLAVVQLRHLGGALTRQTEADGPQGGIGEQYSVFALGVPGVPELVPAIEGAFAAVRGAVAGQLTGRTFFNFRGAETDASSCFSPAAAARLREVKQAVDPDRVFRSNRPTR
jgi:hypothetical protein